MDDRLQMTGARIVGLHCSDGGVPKLAVPVARVTSGGMVGDRQRDLTHHGGPDRALCLYAREHLETLRGEGHPIVPGAIGENVLVEGVPWAAVVPGRRLILGDGVEIEVTAYAAPCTNIAPAFADGRSVRVSQKVHPGWSRVYARVLTGGTLRVGDAIVGGRETSADGVHTR
jgi:MOSC domain-containing protein YiiM